MSQIRYVKPSGIELLVNDTEANREYAKVNRWERKEEKKPAKKRKVDKVK